MAFSKIPRAFFGPDFAVSAGNIIFGTASKTPGTAAATFTAAPVDDYVMTLASHNLKVGDAVVFTGAAVGGITLTSVVYYVLTTPTPNTLTFSATPGGTTLALSDGGVGTTTISVLGLLASLTDVDAEPATTGDWRKIIYSLMEMLYRRWTSTTSFDRPKKISISRNSGIDPATLEVVLTYTVRVAFAASTTLEVADE